MAAVVHPSPGCAPRGYVNALVRAAAARGPGLSTLGRPCPFRDARSSAERTPFLAEIFLISAAALVLEISYTRIISFKLYYYYTYLVIGLALLGLGSGAVVVAVSKRLKAMPTRRLLMWCSTTGAGGVVLGYLVVALMPLDTILLWEGSTGDRIVTMLQLLGICLGLYVELPADRHGDRDPVRPPAAGHQPALLLRPRRRRARLHRSSCR